jgi:chromosome segregation protein
VYLRAISIRGFKSFPDPIEIRLEPGVAVVVGPNGSGKSNVADALLWASGSLAPSELRAEKPDDVLFSGSTGRPVAAYCEVELRFDEAAGALAGLDYEEVAITRRLHRGGEGQYLINGATVRRADVVELLADLGLGPGAGAVVGPGRVATILSSSPSDRRALVEEAAGLGRFKRRRHRAELKLARVAVQVERARDLEREVQKRLRPLALQATAAERAEKLGVEVRRVQAGIAALDLEALDGRIADARRRRSTQDGLRAQIDARLESLLREREQTEERLANVAGGNESAAAALYRLQSARERVEMRREAASALLGRLQTPVVHDRGDELREQARLADARARAVERALAEREGLAPAARALAERGERLALSLVDVETGHEQAVTAALGHRAAAIVASGPAEGLALLEQARAAGLGSLVVLVGRQPAELVASMPVVPLGELLAAQRPSVTIEGYGYDPERGELWFAGETAEAFQIELEAQARRLRAEAGLLVERAAASTPTVRQPDGRLVAICERLRAGLVRSLEAAARIERPLAAAAETGGSRAAGLATSLRELAAQEAELRREAHEATAAVSQVDVELARLEAEEADARRRLEEAREEPAAGERVELQATLERLERRRDALGGVNPFAKEEYAREKAHLEELRTQTADLEESLGELESLRRELTETVERRFTDTFAAVQENFAEVASTLFPGGEGRLRLTEPATEDEEPGIEVELRPAGKRVSRLSLLSGGEKALGALSFLFALFLARPCPFYLLDEVEAALDDTNIGRFVDLLRRFSERAQFIVVTHQKRTMEAADVLYGVTMGKDAVSQVVSRRLPRDEAAETAA